MLDKLPPEYDSRVKAMEVPGSGRSLHGRTWHEGMGRIESGTLQETNISYLAKRNIIFGYALSRGYASSLEGKMFQREFCVKGPAGSFDNLIFFLPLVFSARFFFVFV